MGVFYCLECMEVVHRIGPARRFFMQEAGGAVRDLPRLRPGMPL